MPKHPYSCAELRYRPIEHVLDALGSRDIAEALGIEKGTALRLAADPGRYIDTPYELTDEKIQMLRDWLERQCEVGT